jgi:hypothetical protein
MTDQKEVAFCVAWLLLSLFCFSFFFPCLFFPFFFFTNDKISNRATMFLRRLGHVYMANHCVRAFLGIKIWGCRSDRTFAAVAVLWTKSPETDEIGVAEAIEFGTVALSQNCRADLETAVAFGLPPVPASRWQRQAPAPAAALSVTIPPALIVFETIDWSGKVFEVPATGVEIDVLELQEIVVSLDGGRRKEEMEGRRRS